MANDIFTEYLAYLQHQGVNPERQLALSDKNHSVLLVPGLGYVLVIATVEFPGLWVVEQTFLTKLEHQAESQSQPLWIALLIARRDGRGANGYILSDLNSTPVKRPIEPEEGQFIIREKRHLDSLRLILSTEKQVDLLLRHKT